MYTQQTRVRVLPLTRQVEGEMVVIGRPETGKFVAVPADAVEVLDHLAAGHSVGEAADLFRRKYGVVPDMDDFLGLLSARGFITPLAGIGPVPAEATHLTSSPATIRYHFNNVPQAAAQRLFNRYTVTGSVLLGATALWLAILDPALRPARNALYFTEGRTPKTLLIIAISLLTIFAHEMGHLLAARAAGVSSRLGVGNRYWVLVAETDMTGLWSVPRRMRYLPMIAGPLVDINSLAVLWIALFAEHRGWIHLPAVAVEIFRAMVLLYSLGLLWQCFFFVRTDLYYVIATFFGCKQMMSDTRGLLHNVLARVFRFMKPIDQSGIPRREMWVIRMYLPVVLVGRVLAIVTLARVTIPLIGRYLGDIAGALAVPPHSTLELWDTLTGPVIYLLPLFIGGTLWMRQHAQRHRRSA